MGACHSSMAQTMGLLGLRAVEAGKVGCGDMEFVHVGFEEPFRRRTVRARAGLEPRGLIVTGLIWECRDKA